MIEKLGPDVVFEFRDIGSTTFREVARRCLERPHVKRFEIGVYAGETVAYLTVLSTHELTETIDWAESLQDELQQASKYADYEARE